MYISIVGTAGSGKTTLFKALAENKSNGPRNGANNASPLVTIEVPDERLDALTKIFNPKKTVYSRIEVADTVAIREGEVKNETLDAKSLQWMRKSDAILLIVRHFDHLGAGDGADPIADFRTIHDEFLLSDMAQIEVRLERIAKQGKTKTLGTLDQEKALLEQCLSHLESGQLLSTLPLSSEDEKKLRGFQFLSRKPMMVVLNCAEKSLDDATVVPRLQEQLPKQIPVITACAQLEAELASMSSDEQAQFMAEYGLTEAVRGRIIRLARDTLGLISFLTVGDDECRAWPIRCGSTAQDAAGTIHTDFYQKFIRAEAVAYKDFMGLGGFAGCKKAGVWRLEGKTYLVQDGDILCIRAGN
jgi:ribosome-binding ATPase